MSPTASRHRHAGLAFFLRPAAAAGNFHFYVLLPNAGARVLEDGDQDEFLLALRRLSDACGGVQSVAVRARLNPTTLYRTLSARGNPELKSMRALVSGDRDLLSMAGTRDICPIMGVDAFCRQYLGG